MLDLTQSKRSPVGETSALDESKKVVDSIVDDMVKDVNLPESHNKREKGALDEPAQLGEVGSPKPLNIKTEDDGNISVEDQEAEGTDESGEDKGEGRETEDKVEADEDEKLIPQSKVNGRFAEKDAKIKSLEFEVQRLTKQVQKSPTTREEKLASMNPDSLKELRIQTRMAQISATDENKLREYVELEEDIIESMKTYTQRFVSKQNSALQSILPEFANIDPEVIQFKGKLWSIADDIFQQTKSLHSSEIGKVEALMLAVKHFEIQRSQAESKEKASTLNRQVNQLKNKTSLEGKTRVAQEQGVNLNKLRETARNGSILDKEKFFREALVPEEFLKL